MRNTTTFAVAALVLSVSLVAESRGAFIQPSSITASSTTINSAGVLINAATGGGGTAYVAPNPGSGGGGTSWYTSAAGTTGVTLNFGFDDHTHLDTLYLWDYYTHSPGSWNLKLYSGAGATGTELLDHPLTFTPGASPVSTQHVIDFVDTASVLSGVLTSVSNAPSGGVGLAEFGFTTFVPPVPEPSSVLLLGLGLLGLVRHTRRRTRRA